MDIVVVGAGPAGSYVSFLLAKAGYNVNQFELKKDIGVPMQCTGIVTESINQIISLPKDLIINKVNYVSVNVENTNTKIPLNDIVIDRIGFDKYLSKIACEAGVKLHLNSFVKEVGENHVSYIQNQQIFRKKFDILIGADGPKSIVFRKINPQFKRHYYKGKQYIVKGNFDITTYQTYFGDFIKGFFGWVVPESNDSARIGLASPINPGPILDVFMKRFDCKIISSQGGLIPIYDQVRLNKKNIYIIGDAALMVKATTGGGIIQGLKAAKLLSDSIINKKNFSKLFEQNLKSELEASKMIRNVLDKFSEKDYIDLIKIINSKKVNKILSQTTRDDPVLLMIKLFLARPSLIRFIPKLF